MRVPQELLHKAGPLTPEERAGVRMHPVWGVELLMDVEFPWDIKPIIRWHHERCDGSGYPDGLKGDEIPLTAQVVGTAEVYDALTSVWDHGPALPVEEALQRITGYRSWWSERVFQAFFRAVSRPSGASDTGQEWTASVMPSGRIR